MLNWKKTIYILKNKLNLCVGELYSEKPTTIITICWIIASSHLTILYKYENCISNCDIKNTFKYIFVISLLVFSVIFMLIILYFYFNKNKIGIEKIKEIEENNQVFGRRKPQVFILPIYLFFVFSLSKFVVIFYESVINSFSIDNITKMIILLIIGIFSFIAWIKFKETSSKSWSFWITIFAITYVIMNIFWEYFLPFLQSYIKTWNCIFTLLLNS